MHCQRPALPVRCANASGVCGNPGSVSLSRKPRLDAQSRCHAIGRHVSRGSSLCARPMVQFMVGASRRCVAPPSQSTVAASSVAHLGALALWPRRPSHCSEPSRIAPSIKRPTVFSTVRFRKARQRHRASLAPTPVVTTIPIPGRALYRCSSQRGTRIAQIPPPNMALQPTANGLAGLGLHFILAQTRQAVVCG